MSQTTTSRPMTEEERIDWNIHRNITGWALIAYCASRFFARLPKWDVSPRFATLVEGSLVLLAVITALWAVLARNKRTREEVPWMTSSPWVLRMAIVVSAAYLILLAYEAWQG